MLLSDPWLMWVHSNSNFLNNGQLYLKRVYIQYMIFIVIICNVYPIINICDYYTLFATRQGCNTGLADILLSGLNCHFAVLCVSKLYSYYHMYTVFLAHVSTCILILQLPKLYAAAAATAYTAAYSFIDAVRLLSYTIPYFPRYCITHTPLNRHSTNA